MRVIMMGVLMVVVLMLVIATMIVVTKIVVAMIVVRRVRVVARRHGGADGGGTVQRLQKRKKCAPLHPQQSHADENDERIAHDFNDVDRTAHGRRARAQQRGRDPYHRYRDQRLQHGRGEGQDHAAHQGFVVRNDI